MIIQNPKKSKQKLQLNKDWRPVNWSATGSLINKEVVWAGYGIQAPGEKEFKEIDQYCKEKEIEPNSIARLVNKALKQKIQMEAEELHFLPKTNSLPV